MMIGRGGCSLKILLNAEQARDLIESLKYTEFGTTYSLHSTKALVDDGMFFRFLGFFYTNETTKFMETVFSIWVNKQTLDITIGEIPETHDYAQEIIRFYGEEVLK
jgi:hypothetical protein